MTTPPLGRVLLVDDDVDLHAAVRQALGALEGLTLRAVRSGRQALQQAPRFRPDLILLDAVMPRMDGPATLKALRDKPDTADVPVIFLTARARAEDAAEFKELGAIGVIPKPFNPAALAETVRRFWTQHFAEPE